MSAVAIILARGGSKRIPRKNTRPFYGKPVIHYSIHAAIQSGCFDEVMVSTDDEEIATLAREAGATTPFPRSARTSNDQATTTEALREVVETCTSHGRVFDLFCAIYGSSPLITAEHLRDGFDLISSDPIADTVMPVVRFGYPVQRAFRINDGYLSLMQPEFGFTRSQDLPVAYHDAGQWYWLRRSSFLTQEKVFMKNCVPVILPETEVQDIDNEEDWLLAEAKYALRQREKL